jgi:ketosteroid isomerase-like protein
MQKFYIKKNQTLICLCMLFAFSTAFGQPSEQASIDLQKTRVIIDSLDKQFSKHYFNGDSAAIYAMYAKGAIFGSLKGNEILLSWGKQVRNSIKNDARNLIFTTASLSSDSEFLVELGTYEVKDSNGGLKGKGKYLVVWKQEGSNWKLYRDIGL